MGLTYYYFHFILATAFNGFWRRWEGGESNYTHTFNCTHTSAITFECSLLGKDNRGQYSISGTTITWEGTTNKWSWTRGKVKGTYDGNRTVRWDTGGIWVKQVQGRRNSLSYIYFVE